MIPVPANACGSSCNQPPFASFDAYQSGITQWSFDASDSRDIDGTIVSYFWSFGDGETATTTNPYASHYFGPGEYTIWLTVTDDDGACNSTWVSIKNCPE
jgi:PKD repeat protein